MRLSQADSAPSVLNRCTSGVASVFHQNSWTAAPFQHAFRFIIEFLLCSEVRVVRLSDSNALVVVVVTQQFDAETDALDFPSTTAEPSRGFHSKSSHGVTGNISHADDWKNLIHVCLDKTHNAIQTNQIIWK